MLSGLGGMNRDHELLRHVQQNAGIKDPKTARQYTQQGVDVLNEQSKSNPQGLQSSKLKPRYDVIIKPKAQMDNAFQLTMG